MNKISIIIPVYNTANYLRRCLDSVVNQTYENLEIICINDGSKDNSLEILKSYSEKDDRIIIIDKENEGLSAARNDGIKKSSGEYIAFIDSDDWIETNFIERLYDTLIKEECDIVRCNFFLNNKACDNIKKIYNTKYSVDLGNYQVLCENVLSGKVQSYVCLLLIKKKILNKVIFDEKIRFMEDREFWTRLLNVSCSFYFINECLYHYWQNFEGLTFNPSRVIQNIELIPDLNRAMEFNVNNGEYSSTRLIELIKWSNAKCIMSYIYKLFYYSSGYDDFKQKIIKICSNSDITNLLKSIDLFKNNKNFYSFVENFLKYLVFNKYYRFLYCLYCIRKFIS